MAQEQVVGPRKKIYLKSHQTKDGWCAKTLGELKCVSLCYRERKGSWNHRQEGAAGWHAVLAAFILMVSALEGNKA